MLYGLSLVLQTLALAACAALTWTIFNRPQQLRVFIFAYALGAAAQCWLALNIKQTLPQLALPEVATVMVETISAAGMVSGLVLALLAALGAFACLIPQPPEDTTSPHEGCLRAQATRQPTD